MSYVRSPCYAGATLFRLLYKKSTQHYHPLSPIQINPQKHTLLTKPIPCDLHPIIIHPLKKPFDTSTNSSLHLPIDTPTPPNLPLHSSFSVNITAHFLKPTVVQPLKSQHQEQVRPKSPKTSRKSVPQTHEITPNPGGKKKHNEFK